MSGVVSCRCVGGGGRGSHQGRCPRRWAGPSVGCSVIPSPRRCSGGMMGCAVLAGRSGSIRGGDHAEAASGVMTCTTRDRPGSGGGAHAAAGRGAGVQARGRGGRAARRRPARAGRGRRRPPRCCGPGGPRPGPGPPDPVVPGQDLHRLDRGPADQPGALLGDPAAVHVGVGLVVLGGQPGPAGQLRGAGEPGDVTDLGDEHRAQDRPDPGDRAGPRR